MTLRQSKDCGTIGWITREIIDQLRFEILSKSLELFPRQKLAKHRRKLRR